MAPNTFSVARDDIKTLHRFDDGSAELPLADGAVRLRVGPFALTSNNVTYATFGTAMGYFDFFPAPDSGAGCIPAWGFGDVVESRSRGVEVGERYYGFLPMSSHAVLHPTRQGEGGFLEGSPHRVERAPIYNQYARCATDPMYAQEFEAQLALLRPLFTTAFLIDEFVATSGMGAQTVVLSSASSKTAYATAFCLAQRRGTPEAVEVVGLTSERNLAFTRRLGCYDEVITYDQIENLAVRPAIYVDMAGSGAVTSTVHARFGDSLGHSAIVGGTHWSERGGGSALVGPAPALFFAPAHAKARMDEWGAAEFSARVGRAWKAFMERVCAPDAPWLQVRSGSGLDAVIATYEALLAGTVPADEGHVLTI